MEGNNNKNKQRSVVLLKKIILYFSKYKKTLINEQSDNMLHKQIINLSLSNKERT